MTYHIAINRTQSGPHTEQEVQNLIAQGRLKGTDLCWREGWAEWQPVATGIPRSPSSTANVSAVPAPSAPFSSFVATPADDNTANEEIRHAHLRHEASIQGIGSLYCFGGVLLALGSLGLGIAGVIGTGSGEGVAGIGIGMALALGLFAVLQLWVGLGLRRLNPRVTIPATIFAAIGLFGFPIGTLINGYILFLLHGQKGKVVLGEGYREIVAATPHIRYRTPVYLYVVLVILVGGGIAGIVAGTKR